MPGLATDIARAEDGGDHTLGVSLALHNPGLSPPSAPSYILEEDRHNEHPYLYDQGIWIFGD